MSQTFPREISSLDIAELTAQIASAHLSHTSHTSHAASPEGIGALIRSIGDALRYVAGMDAKEAPSIPSPPKPTASEIRKSIRPDALISFLDGKPYKMLKRHLGLNGHTPDSYRERFGLPHDYPMTAAAYSEQRKALAVASGLGRKKA
jgi:predicted transcriptional regulator